MNRQTISCFTFCSLLALSLCAQNPYAILVKANEPIADVQPTMWGVFFEDINFAADGGIYAELIKNRSFEFSTPLMGWKEQKSDRFSTNKASGYTLVVNRGDEDPLNPRFARITVNADKGYGLSNEGFRGMGIKKEMQYNFSMLASQQEGSATTVRIELVDPNGNILGESTLSPMGKAWRKYEVSFKATATESKAMLNIWFDGKGVIDVDMISLFPNDTWKNRPNGLRADLVQLLADLKPGFLRFPGGCIVEGRELATRYQWKKTIGDIGDRKMIINRWNSEFTHRPAPDYFQTFGLGFFEYFQLAEDIGASPLPILSCGMACQFNTAEVVPMNQLDPYIQDALDLIEFANGSPTTVWGKVRADMGHPAPFNLKMIGIGNEQWGTQYIERYKVFVASIKEKYPTINIVTGNGPFPDGELFDYADKELRALHADIIDEHYYRNPEWFFRHATRYDAYDRKGPKIFAGEYAAQSVAIASPDNKNNWQCALSEAAFMTGLERNAAVVTMCSYAPLFAHTEGWQWTPNLIWFNNLRAYGTANYYVQKLFSTNKGSMVLPMLYNNEPLTGQNGLYASAVLDDKTHEIILKIVNSTNKAELANVMIEGVKKLGTKGKMVVLMSEKLDAVNSLEAPQYVAPLAYNLAVKGKKVSCSLPPNSFTVIHIPTL
jgi:alpha-N-arabinofuranosidase